MASLQIEELSGAFGASFRIGYRQQGNLIFNYLSNYITLDDIPYTFTVATAGSPYEVEVTQICPNCAGGVYSDPVVVTAISTP